MVTSQLLLTFPSSSIGGVIEPAGYNLKSTTFLVGSSLSRRTIPIARVKPTVNVVGVFPKFVVPSTVNRASEWPWSTFQSPLGGAGRAAKAAATHATRIIG